MTDHQHKLDTDTTPVAPGEPRILDYGAVLHSLLTKQELARKQSEDSWFQRLHDTIRAAVEEGTLAALQRHDDQFRHLLGKVNEPGGEQTKRGD